MSNKLIKILLVEDDVGDAKLLIATMRSIEHSAFDFTHVQRLSQALDCLNKEHFDVIVTDLSLPDSVGLESVCKLHSRRSALPIVVLTGLTDENIGLSALSKGAQDYLIKGQINYPLFSRAIHHAIERKRLEAFKDEFLSNVSHELRTPLTIIRESISQMEEGLFGDINEKQNKYLAKALINIDRLRNIIDNLLDISKIEAGKFDIFKEQDNINDVVREVVANFETSAELKGVRLSYDLPEYDIAILMDKEKLIQVFTNLIANALKFTRQGEIKVTLSDHEAYVEACVSDTGVGIAKKDLNKMFSKFEQIGRQQGPGERGTGLGLSIVKGIVELHDGSISVESQEDKGTTFMFTLPKKNFNQETVKNIHLFVKEMINRYNTLAILKFSVKESKNPQFNMHDVVGVLQQLINQCLHRKNDATIQEQSAVYAVLPDTDESDVKVIGKRIRQIIDGNIWRKQLRNVEQFKFQMCIFPKDGLTADELLMNLEKHEGWV